MDENNNHDDDFMCIRVTDGTTIAKSRGCTVVAKRYEEKKSMPIQHLTKRWLNTLARLISRR